MTSNDLITADEYLDRERLAETKSEYIAGRVRAMAGASPEHVSICFTLAREVGAQIRGSACRGAGSDLRVWIEACNRYYYPDMTVTCGGQQFATRQGMRSLVNPAIIFEVLSEATEQIDRREKFDCYREIESLAVYVLIAQRSPRVDVFIRDSSAGWQVATANGLDAEIVLPVADCTLRLRDIYEDVEFSADSG